MSNSYLQKVGIGKGPFTTSEMREHCKRPGTTDENGKIIYFTEQHHKEYCDINNIVKKYDTTGLLQNVTEAEGKYGDVSGLEYKEALDLVIGMESTMAEMPSHIRKYFKNDPRLFAEFMENPDNREKAIELGLINRAWEPDLDGLGEHVTKEQAKERDKPKKEQV